MRGGKRGHPLVIPDEWGITNPGDLPVNGETLNRQIAAILDAVSSHGLQGVGKRPGFRAGAREVCEQILRGLATGDSTREIADNLGYHIRSVTNNIRFMRRATVGHDFRT